MKFSSAQQRAIYTKNKNLLVSAAAGSGKTAVLTERIVQTVKSPSAGIDSLLVLTFNKAAAAEMQTRIRGRLKELIDDPKESDKTRLIKQLRLLNNAEICTIDSFCCRLLKQFFYKTDIDPAFTPAESSRLTPLRTKALDKIVSEALILREKGVPLYAPMYDLCDMFSQKDQTNLQSVIADIYSSLSALPYPEKWLKTTRERLNPTSYEEYIELVSTLLPSEESAPKTKKADPLAPFKTAEAYESYKTALPSLNLLYTLVSEFMKEYYKLKAEKNTYEFSDIERACLNLLKDENGRETETALALKDRYIEILTDEYQDTSPLQEEILSILSNGKNRFMVGDIKQSIYAFRNAEPAIFTEKYLTYADNPESGELVLLSENFRSTPYILSFVNKVFSKIMTKELGGVAYEPLNVPENSKYTADDNKKTEICIIIKSPDKIPVPDMTEEEADTLSFADSNPRAEALFIAGRIKELMAEDATLSYKDFAIISRDLKGSADIMAGVLALCGIPAVTDKSSESTNFIENKTILSLLKVIDNPLSDIDLTAVLHSPIYRFSAEELAKIKLGSEFHNVRFYYLAKTYAKNHNDEIARRLREFFVDLDYYKNRFGTEPICSVLGEIYEKTDYYNYLNLLTSGKMRRANLDKLTDLAAEYDASEESGLYGFLSFISSLTEGGSFTQAQTLSPENNTVRIMTIHRSKGLQFPVVFLSQISKSFKKPKKSDKALFSKSVGIALCDYNPKYRAARDSLTTLCAKELKNRENLAEEMRLFYVALTRAEKRLIITACENPRSNIAASTLEELSDKVTAKYSKSLCGKDGTVPPAKIYKSSSILPILMGVLAAEPNKDDFLVRYIYRHELTGIREDVISSVYTDALGAVRRKKSDYPHKAITKLPTNISVTEIKRMANETNEELFTHSFTPAAFTLKKPGFLRKSSKRLAPNEVGTAYHTLISLIDYKNLPKDIDALKDYALSKRLLTEEEAAAIDNAKINAFLSSSLASEISRAKTVKKEHSFTMGLSAGELYPELKGSENAEEEIILTHGIIDLWFENDRGITIVDFKTDKTTDFESLKTAYRPQLEIYKKAVEQATNRPVNDLLLYLISSEMVLTL